MKMLAVFEKGPRLRLIGHLDLMRAMQRALRRSGLPIRYSQGFNPHILLTFAAPLNLGAVGMREVMEVPVEGEVAPLSTKIQARNKVLEDLGNVLADLTKLQAQFSSDAKGSDRAGSLQQSSKDILIAVFGSLDWSRLDMTKYEVEEWLQKVKSKIDALNNEAQKDMTRLESLVNRRDEAFSTASDLMSKIGDTRSNAIRNM